MSASVNRRTTRATETPSQRRRREALQKRVGARIAELRVAMELTQAQFAQRLDMTMRYLQRAELGETNLTLGSVTRFAHALKVQPEELFEHPAPRTVKRGRPKKA